MDSKKMDETEHLLSSPTMAEVLRQGKKDLQQGKGKVVKLDELWNNVLNDNTHQKL